MLPIKNVKECKIVKYEHLILEGKLDSQMLDKLKTVCTSAWDQDFVRTHDGQRAANAVAFRRHDQTVRYILPWLDYHMDLSSTKIIDFGGGCGSSALAFSKVVPEVHSFEIDDASCEAFRRRMELFQISNVEFTQCTPETIYLRAAEAIDPNTTVVLVAVVEHLLENEQITYLKTFWENLAPGQSLIITETPNLLAYFDGHTFKEPFAQFVPDKLLANWLKRNPSSLRFRDDLVSALSRLGENAILERRRRLGLGLTAEPFLQAFGCDLNEIIIGDGFDEDMMRWFPIHFDDRILLSTFNHYKIDLPVGFAKSVLSFIFKKPINSEQANENRARNIEKRQNIIDLYAAKIG